MRGQRFRAVFGPMGEGQAGFTLVETTIALGIIALMIAITLPMISGFSRAEFERAARSGVDIFKRVILPRVGEQVVLTIAELLAPVFDRIYIPSTGSYTQLDQSGTHPLLDPANGIWGQFLDDDPQGLTPPVILSI